MKKIILFLAFAYLITISGCCDANANCGGGEIPYSIRVIDGCEYIECIEWRQSNWATHSLTHKGNCKNTIHYK